jgi:predicted metal-dependent HD superfamily phosphohydrolase
MTPKTMADLFSRWSKLVEPSHAAWTWKMLRDLYGAPLRVYHTLVHVADCLGKLDRAPDVLDLRVEPFDRKAAELALFWHDAVYVPADKRNEKISAGLLCGLGEVLTVGERTLRIAELAVLDTQRHELAMIAENPARAVVVDIDLSVLGSEQGDYDDYVRAIRSEYAISNDAWRVGRGAFLAKMLERKRIFHTEWMRSEGEARARLNMRRELDVLETLR